MRGSSAVLIRLRSDAGLPESSPPDVCHEKSWSFPAGESLCFHLLACVDHLKGCSSLALA